MLHVDAGRGWGGGQQQAAWLIEGLRFRGADAGSVCPPGSVMEERARAAGWPVHTVAMRGDWDAAAGARVARIARAGGYGILHAQPGHALAVCLWARLSDRRLRVVASRRADHPARTGPLNRIKLRTHLLDRIVCASAAERDVLITEGVPAAKLAVIPGGVDAFRFENVRPPPGFRRSLGIPNGHLVVGTIAALAPGRDYPTLLGAARRVLERAPDTTFVAIGDGPLRQDLGALARSLQLGRRFLFAGFREDVGSFLRLFDLFVIVSGRGGASTATLDAQSAGLPAVACGSGGGETLRDRETALLAPPEDPEALAGRILELLEHPELRASLGQEARRRVRELDISRTVEEHLRLYRALSGDRA